ncbi:hypothetical protein ACWZHB_07185 [Nocardia sp. FBN12]|uniref:hypothetical protein n=1 Tax=Nocardia sp. FBN12 TaxID=3419766 RepID=UPI003D05BCAD
MDFLLLFSDRQRVVIELDGRQHYADDRGLADPIHRSLDDDDKLIVVPADREHVDDAVIAAAVAFQEIEGRYRIVRE